MTGSLEYMHVSPHMMIIPALSALCNLLILQPFTLPYLHSILHFIEVAYSILSGISAKIHIISYMLKRHLGHRLSRSARAG